MNYYYFISGLQDLSLDQTNNVPDRQQFLNDLETSLTKKDKLLFDVLLYENDNKNFLRRLNDPKSKFIPFATVTAEKLSDTLELLTENGLPNKPIVNFPPYLPQVYLDLQDEEMVKTISSVEDYITTHYYNFGLKSKNKFLSSWFELNLNINNILTALACRKYDWDIKQAIVGHNNVAECIRNNTNAHDFNLSAEMENFSEIASIAEETNLYNREKRIDTLKWEWLEEHSFFNYFTIERILVFWLRLNLIYRWNELDPEKGQTIFRTKLDDLKKDVNFD